MLLRRTAGLLLEDEGHEDGPGLGAGGRRLGRPRRRRGVVGDPHLGRSPTPTASATPPPTATATPADAPVAPYVKTFSLINDGYFRTYDFRMDGARTSQFFKGTLKALRIQPSETPGCDVAFSYIALHDGDGDIARQWRFAEGRGGWWAANMIDRDLPGSWQLTTSGGAPFIQRDGLDIDLRR